ncbi:MAG: hypothetical protein SVX38_16765, partial [Chloroflexota bacterium]|nr:hypothetical protein [Chloroflexota bacterium]
HLHPHGAWLKSAVSRDVAQALAGVSLVTQVFEQISYAPTPPDHALMHEVRREGRRLRWRLWRLRTLSNVSPGGPSTATQE